MHFRILKEFLEFLTEKRIESVREQYWAGFGPRPWPDGLSVAWGHRRARFEALEAHRVTGRWQGAEATVDGGVRQRRVGSGGWR
jgi:hypothetical protein